MLTDDEALRAIRQVAGELNEIGAAWREQIARLQRDAGDAFRRAITPALGIADAVRQAVEKMQADVTLVGQQFQDAVRRGVDPRPRRLRTAGESRSRVRRRTAKPASAPYPTTRLDTSTPVHFDRPGRQLRLQLWPSGSRASGTGT